jgi:hypothetical protein
MFVIHLLSLNFVFQTKALVDAVIYLALTLSQPVYLSRSFLKSTMGLTAAKP